VLWFKHNVEGPAGNVLAAAFILFLIIAYLALRAQWWRIFFHAGGG
jgi:hypothetical protein